MKPVTHKKSVSYLCASFLLALVALMFISGCSSSDISRPTVGRNIGIANESETVSEIQEKHLCGADSRLIKSYANSHSRADVCSNKVVSYERKEDKLENKTEHNLEDIVARMQLLDSSRNKFLFSISFVNTTNGWFFATAEILDDGEAEVFEISHGNLVINLICGANRGEASKLCSSAF